MKNNKSTSLILVFGVVILCVFIFVITYYLMPKNNQSNSYYVKVGETMSAKIDSININNNTLTVTTTGDAKEFCVKTTVSNPGTNSLCWKNVENGVAKINIYRYKQYYIWIKDNSGNISSPMSIDSNREATYE